MTAMTGSAADLRASRQGPITLSLRRIGAIILRHLYVMRGSWPRMIELMYWPALSVLMWGYINRFMQTASTWVAAVGGVFLAAVLLWEVCFRSQMGVFVSFLEEMWSRNLGHLGVSPLRPWEWLAAMLATSIMRVAVGVVPAMGLAWLVFDFSILDLGPSLIGFVLALLMVGWWLGMLTVALLLRFGLTAESFAWLGTFLLAPVSCIYYPLSVLPPWLQHVANALPMVHVFEGLRALLFQHQVRMDMMGKAFALDFVYLALSMGVFMLALRNAQIHGRLLQTGE